MQDFPGIGFRDSSCEEDMIWYLTFLSKIFNIFLVRSTWYKFLLSSAGEHSSKNSDFFSSKSLDKPNKTEQFEYGFYRLFIATICTLFSLINTMFTTASNFRFHQKHTNTHEADCTKVDCTVSTYSMFVPEITQYTSRSLPKNMSVLWMFTGLREFNSP
jgi:hypothetical protein